MTEATSEIEPFTFSAPLTVCVDVRHPLCYLALAPVRKLADELGITVDWLPFPADPMKPPPQSGDDRGTRHRRTRARYTEADIERYARSRGLTIRGIYRAPDSNLASLALLWLREHAPGRRAEFLDKVCEAYWAETMDLADPAALHPFLEAVGVDAAGFGAYAEGSGRTALARLREQLVAAGVFTVPSLVVDDEVFVGRAHLPMVRWMLTGREGPPPV